MTPTDIRDTAIPEDVMEAAREVGGSAYSGSQWEHMRRKFVAKMYDDHPVVLCAARAIMAAKEAERERCAKVAEDEDGAITHWGEDRNTRVSQKTGKDIAAAIRAGTKGETP